MYQDSPVPAGSAIVVGVPFDGTTSFMPGTRLGPRRIREASWGLETYSPTLHRCLDDLEFFDAGNLEPPLGDVHRAMNMIERTMSRLFDQKALPVMLGGEHLITLPAVKACHAHHSQLVAVQIDAHADLRDDYLGDRYSHATVMRRVGEIIGSQSVYQLGIRSGMKEEFEYGKKHSGGFYPDLIEGPRQLVEAIGDRPVYLTIDIDAVDPGFAPGTGTPEPGGCHPRELFQALYGLKGLNVVAIDLVEVNPMVDVGYVTSILGAKVVREAVLAFAS